MITLACIGLAALGVALVTAIAMGEFEISLSLAIFLTFIVIGILASA